MLEKRFFVAALIGCCLSVSRADTIQLKSKAAITGSILAEKSDQVVVDVGYTVLVIPRNQIAKISKATGPETPAKHAERSEEHTSELQSHLNLVCRLLLEKKK